MGDSVHRKFSELTGPSGRFCTSHRRFLASDMDLCDGPYAATRRPTGTVVDIRAIHGRRRARSYTISGSRGLERWPLACRSLRTRWRRTLR
jgi:hypothetical protein